MGLPLAYFITWSTRGTWLHGDERGSVDREHNQYGFPRVIPNQTTQSRRQSTLSDDVVSLSREARDVVDGAIREVCRRRDWRLHALNVRSNHVHVVAGIGAVSPETAMQQLKSWGTRALYDAGLFERNCGIWTRHGSTRYLWDQKSLDAAIVYVMDEQDRVERFRSEPRA